MIYEHDFKPPDANGKQWCGHCGVLLDARIAMTCIGRKGDPVPRGWNGSALDDNDAIGARLIELRKERQAVLDAPAPVEMSDEDLICG